MPVLIPIDMVEAIVKLVASRESNSIKETNPFLFASKGTTSHSSSWHAVHRVCKAAGVSVTPTKNRHRVSTLYAAQDMTADERKIFLDHMGHSDSVNKSVYACPIGEQEIAVMGSFLSGIDGLYRKFIK